MKTFALIPAVILTLCATALSQNAPKPEVRTFDLTPVAPPIPALKYQLHFDDSFDRRPGNAAMLYLDSILLMGQDAKDKASKALDAYDSKDMTRFNSLADSLNNPNVMQELDLAARREQCDWQSPFREMGTLTLLPYLSPVRDLSRILKVRALHQIEQGKIDDALKTIRLGYEMADKVAREPVLINLLVSINMVAMMNDCLREIMNRSDSLNLYWALAEFPSQHALLRISFDGERQWWTANTPELAKLKAGEELSADQWRTVFNDIGRDIDDTHHHKSPDPVHETSPELMQQARQQYAADHHMTPDQSAAVDPLIIIGSFYFRQYQIGNDDMFKLRGLAYPVVLAKSKEYGDRFVQLRHNQPANLFLEALPNIHRGIWDLARIDRELAAMTTVEAIRSYAAANNGQVPARLEDLTDTPAPDNPATGLPFDYSVNNGTATISDSQSEESMTYTIQIRK